jgi:hypothetical protein
MATPYKVFLSAPDDPDYEAFLGATRTALWRMDQMMISAMSAMDIAPSGEDRIMLAKQAFETTALFLGIYGANYGTVPEGDTLSYAEQEYRLAQQRGIVCAIFMTEDSKNTRDERVKHFAEYLQMHHVIHYFTGLDDLQAKVIVAVNNFLKTNRGFRLLPPAQNFAPEAVPQGVTLENLVNDAMRYATDDIEQIIQRTLQVWDAQKHLKHEDKNDGWLRIAPVFGEPLQQSQFQADIFMIMPFREQYDSVYQNVVRPVVGSLNMSMKRGDDFNSVTGVIMQEVWAAINACKLVIVETSEVNANVYYELGIAHTLGKPAILLTQAKEVEDIPFDVRHLRFIRYENTIEGGEKLANDLRHSIVWIVNDLKERNAST